MKGRRASFKRAPKRAPPPGGRARAATRPFASAPSTADRTPPEIENFLPKGDALVAFLPEGKWFDNVAALPAVAPLPTGVKNAPDLVLAKMKRGLMLYEALVQKYEHDYSSNNSTDDAWMKTVLRSGTTSDKMSATTLLVQQAPLYRLKYLDTLLGMAEKKGRRESTVAISSLKDLFNLGSVGATDAHLIAWTFEDLLRQRYSEFVAILERGSRDTIEHFKGLVLRTAFDLLCERPEQERSLLAILINKLGDTQRSVASKASYLMTLLLEKHTAMKVAVVKEISTYLHRPHIAPRAQYYAVIFLNQIILTKNDVELSGKLIAVYFDLFNLILRTHSKASPTHFGRKSVNTRMLSALLSGVNRAFPFSKQGKETFEAHMTTLFKIVHIAAPAKAIQALLLIWQEVTTRFYRALYERLADASLFKGSRLALALNLVFRALKNDTDVDRVAAFVKRLLQVCLYEQSHIVCALVYVISEVVKVHPSLAVLVLRGERPGESAKPHYEAVTRDDPSPPPLPTIGPETDENDGFYDPSKREPQYSRASLSCFWELTILAKHFHPSVSAWAKKLLDNDRISYGGDPLRDFDLMSFLDRFSYKKPKPTAVPKTGSIMQSHYVPYAERSAPVNSEAFAKLSASAVRPDELFFHKYFNSHFAKEKQLRNKKKNQKKRKGEGGEEQPEAEVDSVDEEEQSDVAESEINRILTAELDADFFDEDEDDIAQQLDYTDDEEEGENEPDERLDEDGEEEDAWSEGDDMDDEDVAAMMAMGEESDDEDGDFVDAESNESEEEPSKPSKRSQRKQKQQRLLASSGDGDFADFDEFAHLLEESGMEGMNPKQRLWEERKMKREQKGPGKKRQREEMKGRGKGGNHAKRQRRK